MKETHIYSNIKALEVVIYIEIYRNMSIYGNISRNTRYVSIHGKISRNI